MGMIAKYARWGCGACGGQLPEGIHRVRRSCPVWCLETRGLKRSMTMPGVEGSREGARISKN